MRQYRIKFFMRLSIARTRAVAIAVMFSLTLHSTLLCITIASASAQDRQSAAATATIGWFGPLSGPVATLGQENLRGIELALRISGDSKIRLITEDDQFSVKHSLNAYEKLKRSGVMMMLSPTYNAVIALAPKADHDKMLVANSLDSSSQIAASGEFILGLGIYAEGHGQNFAKAISKHGAQRVAVFYNQGETFTQLIVDGFKQHYSGKIVLVDGYNPAASDFRSTIARMKALEVDTVLLIGWDETGLFVKQANDAGFLPSVFGLASFTSPGFLTHASKCSLALYYLGWDPQSKPYQEVVHLYQSYYGKPPAEPLFVALGYDAMSLVLKALESGHSAHSLKKNLFSVSVDGLTGHYQLDRDGIVRSITCQDKIFKVKPDSAN
jgi:branched-chain amino acid transport system substrate-binding protein